MKTDEFDEAFRRKVESFHPPFRDDEIDRVQGYVNKHIPMSFWQRFGHTFTYSLGTVIIVSLLTTVIYQANENKNLLNKISSLSNKLEQKQAAIAINDTPKSITVEKTDTVFVVKHIEKEIPVIEEINSANHSIAQLSKTETPSTFKENNIDLNANETKKNSIQEGSNLSNSVKLNEVAKAKKTSDARQVSNLSNDKKSNEEIAKEQIKLSQSKVVNSKTIASETNDARQVSNLANDKKSNEEIAKEQIKLSQSKVVNSKTIASETNDAQQVSNLSNPIKSNLSTESNFSDNAGQFENLSSTTSQESNIKTLTINDLKTKTFSPIDLKFTFDLSNRQLHSPTYVAKTKERKSFKFPSIAMPNLKYRVGLGANADFEQIGTSVMTDILFAKRWSITSGVNMSFLGFEHFGDENEFKRQTDEDFRDEYEVDIPMSYPIKNIETHQVLFRVPIYLNYRLPLRKDYTILFSTGTDLDMHLKQFTSYSHHDLMKDERQEGIQEKIPVRPFNNWMVSAGMEKRWNHFSVQLSPYLSYQIKQISYRKEDFVFGLKVNGFYRLSTK